MDDFQPITRVETYLAALSGEDVTPPEPTTRIEEWLDKVVDNVDNVQTEKVTTAVDAWLSDHVDPDTGYVLDNTLTLDNAAAPAGTVGEELDEVKSAITDLSNEHMFRPLTFLDDGYIYNGSNTATHVTGLGGFKLTEFSQITDGGTNTFGLLKRVVNEQRIPVLSSGQSITIHLYVELATGITEQRYVNVFWGSSNNWNPNNTSFIRKDNAILKNGWNTVELSVVGTAGAASSYVFFGIYASSLALIQNIKSVSAYIETPIAFHADTADKATVAETANASLASDNAVNAGWLEPETPYTYRTETMMTLGGTFTEKDNVYTLTIPAIESSISGQIYGSVSIPIKKYFDKGYIINVACERSANSIPWTWNEVHITKSKTSWGANNILSLTGMATNVTSKEFNIDLDDLGITASSYTDIYLLFAAFQANPGVQAAQTLTIRFTVVPKNSDVRATSLKDFDKSNYYTKSEVNALLPVDPSVKLLFWGDSLTAGAGGGGTSYPGVCAAELGNLTYKNCGVGGETANTIAARQGGNTVIIPAGAINGNYALTDLVDIFGVSIKPMRQGNGSESGNKLYINGVECALTITQESTTDPDAIYTISGYTGGSSAIPLLGKFAGSAFTADVVVIWVGTNGAAVGNDSSIDSRIAIIDSMIAHIDHTRYVIMGLSTGGDSSRATEDAKLLAKYGNHFFPTRKLLVNYGMTINSLTPTAQDETDIASGTVPTSLRYDATHMNAYGYTAIGKLLADKIRSLGYV